MFDNVSIEVKIQNTPTKVHAICTGAVSVKTKFRETSKKGLASRLDFIIDRNFTEWMPIWVWVIEHPERIFIIDTGENADVNNPDYFDSSGIFSKWFNRSTFKFEVSREQEIDKQIRKLNINPGDATVILTHLHLDHIDGLQFFPGSNVIVHQLEWERPYGDLPKLYPQWFRPTLINLNETYDCFRSSAYLTRSRDLIALHTPGHTNGHMSVLLKTDDIDILFAGDVCYHQSQLVNDKYAGVNVSFRNAGATYANIKRFAEKRSCIFLPSHDKEAGYRLQNFLPLKFN
jgi:glyoxylase-like metal-dependent hydrolase (beta-lactamase superfamily II)